MLLPGKHGLHHDAPRKPQLKVGPNFLFRPGTAQYGEPRSLCLDVEASWPRSHRTTTHLANPAWGCDLQARSSLPRKR
ncbi:hypothetical protein CC2G_000502 [Coprinopsis cinerea AmutBmut pab1-1]|nr:hypothetical protein CC2G_000502 [Coprinopsis cinerea AmutBmut pab1-1]